MDYKSYAENLALISHVAASAGVTGGNQLNDGCRGVAVGVNISALTGTTPTLTVFVEGYDGASGQWYTLLQSTALNAVGFTLLRVYPGLTAAANSAANAVLPATWRVRTVIGGTSPAVTATVGASTLV